MTALIPSSLDTPQNVGLFLSFLIGVLGLLSKSNTLMELFETGVKKIMCFPKMLELAHMKLRQNVEVVKEIDKQEDDIVRCKLGIPDEIVKVLYDLAPGEDGTIDEEVASTWIRTVNIIIKNKNKKLKPLKVKNQ